MSDSLEKLCSTELDAALPSQLDNQQSSDSHYLDQDHISSDSSSPVSSEGTGFTPMATQVTKNDLNQPPSSDSLPTEKSSDNVPSADAHHLDLTDSSSFNSSEETVLTPITTQVTKNELDQPASSDTHLTEKSSDNERSSDGHYLDSTNSSFCTSSEGNRSIMMPTQLTENELNQPPSLDSLITKKSSGNEASSDAHHLDLTDCSSFTSSEGTVLTPILTQVTKNELDQPTSSDTHPTETCLGNQPSSDTNHDDISKDSSSPISCEGNGSTPLPTQPTTIKLYRPPHMRNSQQPSANELCPSQLPSTSGLYRPPHLRGSQELQKSDSQVSKIKPAISFSEWSLQNEKSNKDKNHDNRFTIVGRLVCVLASKVKVVVEEEPFAGSQLFVHKRFFSYLVPLIVGKTKLLLVVKNNNGESQRGSSNILTDNEFDTEIDVVIVEANVETYERLSCSNIQKAFFSLPDNMPHEKIVEELYFSWKPFLTAMMCHADGFDKETLALILTKILPPERELLFTESKAHQIGCLVLFEEIISLFAAKESKFLDRLGQVLFDENDRLVKDLVHFVTFSTKKLDRVVHLLEVYYANDAEGLIELIKGCCGGFDHLQELAAKDFRNLPLIPVMDELKGVISSLLKSSQDPTFQALLQLESYLTPNRVDGPWECAEEFLSVHFRLLREECFSSIRELIAQIRIAPTVDQRIHRDVRVLGFAVSDGTIVVRIKYKPHKSISNLMYGNLLCIDVDTTFSNPIWATVKSSEVKKTVIDITPIGVGNSPDHLSTNRSDVDNVPSNVLVCALQSLISCETGVMVESPTYYNAFRPVLSRLQTLSASNFPFASEVLLRSTLPNPSSIGFNFDKDHLPRTMDDSQSHAAAASLETRFSLIQGPPGCGKTFVAKEIVKMMLHCRDFRRFDYWGLGSNYDIFEEFESEDSEEAELREYLSFRGRGPILVMTYKNHALDSFLENCLEFTNSIVRIGGRTTSKAIEEYNLHNLYNEARLYFPKDKLLRLQGARTTLRSLARNIEIIAKESFVGIKASDLLRFLLKREVGKQQIHSLIAKNFEESYGLVIKQDVKYSLPEEVEQAVTEILTCHSTLAGKLLKDALHRWLSESESTEFLPKPQRSLLVNPTTIKKKIGKEKEGEAIEDIALDEDELKEQIAQRIIGREESELEFKAISENTNSIYNNLQKRLAYLEPDERESDVREFRDVWTLSPEGRYILLSYWLRECRKENEQKLSIALKEYNRFYQQVKELEDGRNVVFLRTRDIVACTITGACLRMGVISKVAPSIAIVEEAAEILESQLIAALPSSVRHVVLIGDHKQLPPQVHNYRLAKKFGLGVSIFERLANNNYPVSQLQFHRRGPQSLCPLFSKFYTQDIVALKEDPKPPTALAELGLMYWWSHNAPARNCQNGTSFENEFEAAMIVGAVRLLTWLGKIKASQISIVTGYLGQAKKIKQLLVIENVYGVTVSTIDEIQGDENDFIFLSLTRSFSNEDLGQQSLGFLASPNRQCVALSRARIGLYIFGCSTLFETDTSWKETLDYFRSKDKLGHELRFNIYDKVLTFEHPNDFTLLFKKWETENEQMKLKVQEEFLKELPPENYDGVHDVTEEFGKKIEKLMNKSVLDKRDLGQGRDADGKKFKSFKVLKVKLVFNTNMYLFYLHNQKVIEESRPPPLGFRVDSNADWQNKSLKDHLNEVYLFHGTKPELVDVITNSGFDERVANLGGMYGAGIYFAENADKSDHYTVPDSKNIRYMFLSKVVLGNPYKTQTSGQWRRPPEIDPADPTKLYDSIIAVSGRKGFAGSAVHRHQEFVLFDRYRCLPEFVIEYIRQQ